MVHLEQQELAVMMEAGYIYLGMQRFKEAKEVFEGVAAIRPESEIPWVALGGVAFCQGKLKEAIRIYQKALKMEPGSLYGKAYLGEAFYFDGKKEEAMKLLKEVERLDSKGPVGEFASALLGAIAKGFTPDVLSQKKEVQEYYAKTKTK